MTLLEKLDIYIARLLMVSIFLPERVQIFTAIAISAWFLFRSLFLRLWPIPSHLLSALIPGSIYVAYVIAAFFTPPAFRADALVFCERKAALLALPLGTALIAPRFRTLLRQQLPWFAFATLAMILFANAAFMVALLQHALPSPLSHVQYRQFIEDLTHVHPTYFGMYLCFTIAILLTTPIIPGGIWAKRLGIYIALVALLAIFPKSPIIALIVIAAHYAVAARISLRQVGKASLVVVALIALAYVFIPFFRQRASEMTGLLHRNNAQNITANSVNMRKLIWQTDQQLVQHYWLTGTGPGRILQRLHERYFFHSIYRGYFVGYFDPHNQYFFEWICFGIAGLLLLAAILAIQFRQAIRHADTIYLYLLIIFAVTFFTESLLERQQGVVFYAIFTAIFFLSATAPASKVGSTSPATT